MSVLTVGDLMTRSVEALSPDDDVDLAEMMMRLERFRHMPVVEGGRLVGLVSDRDILRAQVGEAVPEPERRSRAQRIKIATVMTRNVLTVEPETPALEAARLIRRNKISCLPVIEGTRLVGIVTESDFIDHLIHLLSDPGG